MGNANHKAKVKTIKTQSLIWLIPFLTALTGVFLLIQYQLEKGPTITLIFDQAEDITRDKTEIRSMNIKVGTIKSIAFSNDFKHIIATAQLDKQANKMLREDTLFWVIKPRIDREGISGLSTLLSGPYIQMQPGIKNKKQYRFHVLSSAPIAGPDEKGLRLSLIHNQMGKLDVGDPIYFKGFVVGRIEKITLNTELGHVDYQLFIYAPYDSLIYDNTYFWIKNAIDLNISERGFHLQLGSLENLFLGGITFDIPDDESPGLPITTDKKEFTLYDSRRQIREKEFEGYTRFIMLFDESIRGLSDTASIEYRGMRIGSVIKVPFHLNEPINWPERAIPALVSINLNKFHTNSTTVESSESIDDLFEKGLRASLIPSNFLTGKLYINVSFHNAINDYQANTFNGYPIFPTTPSMLYRLQKQASSLLDSMHNSSLQSSINEVNKAFQSTTEFMVAGRKVLNDLNDILESAEGKDLPKSINTVLIDIQRLLGKFNEGSSDYQALRQGLIHLDDVLIQLKPLLEQLNQQPNALIFKKGTQPDIIPKANR